MENYWKNLILLALAEDSVGDDVTAALLQEEGRQLYRADLVAKASGVFSGARCVTSFAELFPHLRFSLCVTEGAAVAAGDVLVSLRGEVGDLLAVERTLINLVSHASGVATRTREMVERVRGYGVTVLATRKTLPGLRPLQLAAVEAGGGKVHRRSLSDGILIKENHQSVVPAEELLRRAHGRRSPLHGIEIEVQDPTLLDKALAAKPDVIMLDNFSPAQVTAAVQLVAGRVRLEVSGGINLANIESYARTGVQYISIGGITHSAPALDMSLDFERE